MKAAQNLLDTIVEHPNVMKQYRALPVTPPSIKLAP
jgi:hypothetical protein